MENNNIHNIDSTTKTLTIIGLIVETFGVIGRFYLLFALSSLKAKILEDNGVLFTEAELTRIIAFINSITTGLIVFSIVTLLLLILSSILHIKLIGNKLTEEQSRKVYLYQKIWGIFNLIINPIVGVAYLASGIRGSKGKREDTDYRSGI